MVTNRIFWMGMHVVLVKTELSRLRQLGFEVYNPPYNSSIYDQSANISWDKDQYTTLPNDIFDKLSKYNFFYNELSDEIADILNHYFGCVIVTINPDWLTQFLNKYKGKIIYRIYGQPYALSDHFVNHKIFPLLLDRDNFYIVPFCEETIDREQKWFKDLCTVVPYHLSPEVFDFACTWKNYEHDHSIALSIPNIENNYYREQYNHFKNFFTEDYYNILGVQRKIYNDFRIAGTLPRESYLHRLQRSSGYFYPYHDRNVCYLPPIEMMTIGGPVIFAKKSLLHRFFKHKAPGLSDGIAQQKLKMQWLRENDQFFIDEIISSQRDIAHRYSIDYVQPIFDDFFLRILNPSKNNAGNSTCKSKRLLKNNRYLHSSAFHHKHSVWFFFHFKGPVIQNIDGEVFALEGIPRLTTKMIESILDVTDLNVIITVYSTYLASFIDFFREHLENGRIALYVLDFPLLNLNDFREPLELRERLLFEHFMNGSTHFPEYYESDPSDLIVDKTLRLLMIDMINDRDFKDIVVVPHFYLFPESFYLDKNFILSLPDYTMHFFNNIPFDISLEKDHFNAQIGKSLCKKSCGIITTSNYSAGYLPGTELDVDPKKLFTLPFPLLMSTSQKITERYHPFKNIEGYPFILYPTANRPNKNIHFLLNVFYNAHKHISDLQLVLTCSLETYSLALEQAKYLNISQHIHFFPGVSDSGLSWLYQNTACMCLTSTMEGNFPPQIVEALSYNAPVVSTRLPHIIELLGEHANSLLLFDARDLHGFVNGILQCCKNPDDVLVRQKSVKDLLFSTLDPNIYKNKFSSYVIDHMNLS